MVELLPQIAENGKNVLSKFVFSGATAATYETEEVLITTSDKRSSAHASGWVGFPPSSYKDEAVGLYVMASSPFPLLLRCKRCCVSLT